MVEFRGKPKSKKEKAKEIVETIQFQKILTENEENKDLIESLSFGMVEKQIGEYLNKDEIFLWCGKVYKVITAHELTSHHNPSTPNTHLYALVLGEDEETGQRIVSDSPFVPFEIKYLECIMWKNETYQLIRQLVNRIDAENWMPPELMNDYWKLIVRVD